MSDTSIAKILAAHMKAKRVALGITDQELAAKVGEPTVNNVSRRLAGTTKFGIDGDLQKYVAALDIPPDEVLGILFPDAKQLSHSVSAELKETKMLLENKRDELELLRSNNGPEMGLVRELVTTGRWAVGVAPHHAGPSPERHIMESIRLAVVAVGPAREEIEATNQDVRRVFNEECGGIVRDRAVFIADSTPDKARPPIDVPDDQVIHLSIPIFARDRAPQQNARSLPKFRPESVVVLSTTQAAWGGRVAALLAKTLGWGLLESSSVYRQSNPISLGDRDQFVEAMNSLRNAGLHEALVEPRKKTFVHHAGRPTVGDNPIEHSLVAVAADPHFAATLPFVILLSESDEAMKRQARKVRRYDDGTPRFSEEQWMQWRDELRHSVEGLPQGRYIVKDVDIPWSAHEELSPSARTETYWARTAHIGHALISQLIRWGGYGESSQSVRHSADRDALKVLDFDF